MEKYRFLQIISLLFLTGQALAQGSGISTNGELALQSLQKSFPDKVSEVEYKDNDWTINAGGKLFYWAGGRILPEEEKDNLESYGTHGFYLIPDKPRAPDTFSPQYIEMLRTRGSGEARLDRKESHRGLQEKIYGASNRGEIEALLEKIDFLDFNISVHKIIAEPLKRIDAAIRNMDGTEDFISSLKSIEGYNWRQIYGTQRMSYHSWGLAVDIQPKSLGGKAIYWLWERGRTEDWMLIPLHRRWSPPDEVISIFEQEGFIWGGKWPLYDNMHFEYRPELHELTRNLAANPVSNTDNNNSSIDLHHMSPVQLGR